MGKKKPTRWLVHICSVCGGIGWAFGHKNCNKGEMVHSGRHNGAVEVMTVQEHEEILERERKSMRDAILAVFEEHA